MGSKSGASYRRGEGKKRAGNKREFNRGVTAGGARLLAGDSDRGGRWV
jgi:hypothetical protein